MGLFDWGEKVANKAVDNYKAYANEVSDGVRKLGSGVDQFIDEAKTNMANKTKEDYSLKSFTDYLKKDVNESGLVQGAKKAWEGTETFFGRLGANAATNANDLDAQRETAAEYAAEFEDLGIKPTQRNLVAKTYLAEAALVAPTLLLAKKGYDALTSGEEPDTADTTIGANIGYTHNVRDLSDLVGGEDEDGLYSRTNRLVEQDTIYHKMAEDGEIDVDTYIAWRESESAPIVKLFNDNAQDVPYLDKNKNYNINDIAKVMKLVDVYRIKSEVKNQSEDYVELQEKYAPTEEEIKASEVNRKYAMKAGGDNAHKEIQEAKSVFDDILKKGAPGIGGTFNGVELVVGNMGTISKARITDIENKTNEFYNTMGELQQIKEAAQKIIDDPEETDRRKKLAQEDVRMVSIAQSRGHDVLNNQREVELAYYKYMMENIGTEGHTTTRELEKSFEKNTGYDLWFIERTRGDNIGGRGGKQAGTKYVSVKSAMADLLRDVTRGSSLRGMEIGIGNIGEGLSNLDKDVMEDGFKKLIGGAYKGATAAIDDGRSHMLGRGIQDTRRGLQTILIDMPRKGFSYDNISEVERVGNSALIGKMENFLPGEARGLGYFLLAKDAAPAVVDGVVKFMVFNKVGLGKGAVKSMKTVDKAGADFLKKMGTYTTKLSKASAKDSTKIIKEFGEEVVKGLKNSSFDRKLGASMAARMFQQSVIMDSVFRGESTRAMTDTDVALSITFAGLFDVAEALKIMQKTKHFAKIKGTTELYHSEKFIDTLAQQMVGENALTNTWKTLSKEQKNTVRAKARGYLNETMGNMIKIEAGVTPKTWEEITAKMDKIIGKEGMTKYITEEGADVIALGHGELKKAELMKRALTTEKTVREGMEQMSEKEIMQNFVKNEDGTYSQTKKGDLIIKKSKPKSKMGGRENTRKNTHGYFINDIIGTSNEKVINSLTEIKIGDKTYSLHWVDEGHKGFNSPQHAPEMFDIRYRNMYLQDLSDQKIKIRGAINIYGGKTNLSIDTDKGIKAIFGDGFDVTKKETKIRSVLETLIEPESNVLKNEMVLKQEVVKQPDSVTDQVMKYITNGGGIFKETKPNLYVTKNGFYLTKANETNIDVINKKIEKLKDGVFYEFPDGSKIVRDQSKNGKRELKTFTVFDADNNVVGEKLKFMDNLGEDGMIEGMYSKSKGFRPKRSANAIITKMKREMIGAIKKMYPEANVNFKNLDAYIEGEGADVVYKWLTKGQKFPGNVEGSFKYFDVAKGHDPKKAKEFYDSLPESLKKRLEVRWGTYNAFDAGGTFEKTTKSIATDIPIKYKKSGREYYINENMNKKLRERGIAEVDHFPYMSKDFYLGVKDSGAYGMGAEIRRVEDMAEQLGVTPERYLDMVKFYEDASAKMIDDAMNEYAKKDPALKKMLDIIEYSKQGSIPSGGGKITIANKLTTSEADKLNIFFHEAYHALDMLGNVDVSNIKKALELADEQGLLKHVYGFDGLIKEGYEKGHRDAERFAYFMGAVTEQKAGLLGGEDLIEILSKVKGIEKQLVGFAWDNSKSSYDNVKRFLSELVDNMVTARGKENKSLKKEIENTWDALYKEGSFTKETDMSAKLESDISRIMDGKSPTAILKENGDDFGLEETLKPLSPTNDETSLINDLLKKYGVVGDEFVADLNKSDTSKNIKNYFNDINKGEDSIWTVKSTNNADETLFYRRIKKDSVLDSYIPKADQAKAVDVYFEVLGTKKSLNAQLKQAGIDVGDVDNVKLKRDFDILLNTKLGGKHKGKTLTDIFYDMKNKTIKNGEDISDMGNNLKSKMYSDLDSANEKLLSNPNFKSQYDAFKKRGTFHEKIMFINQKGKEGFKKQLIEFYHNKKTQEAIYDSMNITYKDWAKNKGDILYDAAMSSNFEKLARQLSLDEKTIEIFSDLPTSSQKDIINNLILEKLKPSMSVAEFDNWRKIVDDFGDSIDPSIKKYADGILKKGSEADKSMENVLNHELDELKKEKKSLDVNDPIALDNEIAKVNSEIKVWKEILEVKNNVLDTAGKDMMNHSSRMSRMLFAQPKDYIGDGYFMDSDMYKAIMSQVSILDDGSSLLSRLSKSNDIVYTSKQVAENEKFMANLVLFRKGRLSEEAAKRPAYVELLESADRQIKLMYSEIADKVGAKYGEAFQKKILDAAENYTEKELSKLGLMLEHNDWLEFIRYTDNDFYKLLKKDQEFVVKIRGEPASRPKNLKLGTDGEFKGYAGAYNMKHKWVMNSLAHDSATIAELKEMSEIVGSVYQASRWVKNSKAAKSLEKKRENFRNLRAIEWMRESAGYRTMKNFASNAYVTSQTLFHPGQLIQLAIMNGQSTLIDPLVKGVESFSKEQLQGIRKEFKLLANANELDTLKGGILTQIRNGDIKTFKELLSSAGNKVAKQTEELSQIGMYNVTEQLSDVKFRNHAISKAIVDITGEGTDDGFRAYMKKAKDRGTDEDVLQRIRMRANEKYTMRNAVSYNVQEGKFMIGNPYSVLGNFKKMGGWAYHFLGSRGNQHVRNYFNLIKGGNANMKKIFAELQSELGTKEATNVMERFIHRNQDITETMQKLLIATSVGDKLNRETTDNVEDDNVGERLATAFQAGIMYYAGAQGLMSSPVGRNVMSALGGILLDNNYEHQDLDEGLAVMMQGYSTMMNNSDRRMLTTNSLVKAWAQMETTNDISLNNLLNYTWNNFVTGTEGYSYFMSNEITNKGSDREVFQTNRSNVEILIPEFNTMKKDAWNISTIKRIAEMKAKIEDSGLMVLAKWMFYKLPIINAYQEGTFVAATDADEFLRDITLLPEYDNLTRGILTIEDGDTNYAKYIVARLTEMQPAGWEKAIRDKDGEKTGEKISQRNDDFRMKYLAAIKKEDGSENIKRDMQNKENLFVKQLFDALDDGRGIEYLNEFTKTDSDGVKAGLRLLAAVESMGENINVPGAGRTLLSAIAAEAHNEFYNDKRYEAGYEWDEEPEDFKKKTMAEADMFIAREYGSLLYGVDRMSYATIALYYARDNLPQYDYKFTGGTVEEGDEDDYKLYTPVMISYEKGKKNEETGELEPGYGDYKSTLLFQTDLYADVMLSNGVSDAADWKNATAAFCGLNNATQAADPEFQKIALNCAANMGQSIEESNLSHQGKTSAKTGVVLGIAPVLSAVRANPNFVKVVGQATIDWVMDFIRGTMTDSAQIPAEIIKREGVRNSYGKLKKGGYEGPEKKTGTLIDGYDKNGEYYSNWFSSDPKGSYEKNKSYYSSAKYYAQDMDYIPKFSTKKSYGSSYYNTPMSKYLHYYYRFRDVKGGNVTVGGRGKQIARNFRTKQTKIKVPIIK